jgi:hypothetical protein
MMMSIKLHTDGGKPLRDSLAGKKRRILGERAYSAASWWTCWIDRGWMWGDGGYILADGFN